MKNELVTDYDIQDFKLFLLKDCPIDELDDYRPNLENPIVRDIVIGFRLNDFPLCDALGVFENPEWKPMFEYWTYQNRLLNQLILIEETDEL